MIHVLGGGTSFDVRPHLSLSARSCGGTARALARLFERAGAPVTLHLTRQADPQPDGRHNPLVTNAHVAALLDRIVADPATTGVVMSCALVDYEARTDAPVGRQRSADGPITLSLTPAEKVIDRVRAERKDVYLMGFKALADAGDDALFSAGLRLMKRAHCNLVVANDMVTRRGMLVVPEEAAYFVGDDRGALLAGAAQTMLDRMRLRFTRSTVVPGDLVSLYDDRVPSNLRDVVLHCVREGAYKRVGGSTAGHFAARLADGTVLTTCRRTDFNGFTDDTTRMVEVSFEGLDRVIARGARPSVGGRSQERIFRAHADAECIVHFHAPLRDDAPDVVNTVSQREYECGSHECGENTARGLRPVGAVRAVMLDNHGPNIVFGRGVPAADVCAFIDRNFALRSRTGGRVYVS